MGKASRDKGNRTERAIVNAFQNAGISAERVPLSGAHGGRFHGDMTAPYCGRELTYEIKCRATGFAEIYRWLGTCSRLICKRDRSEPFVVLRLADYLEMRRRAEREAAE